MDSLHPLSSAPISILFIMRIIVPTVFFIGIIANNAQYFAAAFFKLRYDILCLPVTNCAIPDYKDRAVTVWRYLGIPSR